MDFEKIDKLLKDDFSIKLLRAKNASLIISFLYKEFKENNNLSFKGTDLILKLADYLEFLNYYDNEIDKEDLFQDYNQSAKRYLDTWSDQHYLTKYYDEEGSQIYELTRYTEKAIQWVLSLEKKEFVGTESRFKDIFYKIKELLEQSNKDPDSRIQELEKKKLEIEEEIILIKERNYVKTFDDFQIKSRVNEINKSSKELLSDFREVQDNFKDIIRSIYKKESNTTKGNILKYAFEALDKLRESDQGKSFYAFWNFLINDTSQKELNIIIFDLYKLLDQRNIVIKDNFLKNIERYLYESGKKVVENNNFLAQKITRVISEKDISERKKIKETILEIKDLALKLTDTSHKNNYITLETDANISTVMERKIILNYNAKQKFILPKFIEKQDIQNIDLSKLYSQFYVDNNALLNRIKTLLVDKTQVNLKEIIKVYPLEKGLSEVIAYISLAKTFDRHLIDHERKVLIEFDKRNKKYIEIPEIIYLK